MQREGQKKHFNGGLWSFSTLWKKSINVCETTVIGHSENRQAAWPLINFETLLSVSGLHRPRARCPCRVHGSHTQPGGQEFNEPPASRIKHQDRTPVPCKWLHHLQCYQKIRGRVWQLAVPPALPIHSSKNVNSYSICLHSFVTQMWASIGKRYWYSQPRTPLLWSHAHKMCFRFLNWESYKVYFVILSFTASVNHGLKKLNGKFQK